MPAALGVDYFDPRVGIGMLVRVAQTAFPLVAAVGADRLTGSEFFADDDIGGEPVVDGAPLEVQLATLMSWLEGETDEQAIAAVYDRTRQLYVWDDDIRPPDEQSFMWFTEVGQCACAALLNPGGNAVLVVQTIRAHPKEDGCADERANADAHEDDSVAARVRVGRFGLHRLWF